MKPGIISSDIKGNNNLTFNKAQRENVVPRCANKSYAVFFVFLIRMKNFRVKSNQGYARVRKYNKPCVCLKK